MKIGIFILLAFSLRSCNLNESNLTKKNISISDTTLIQSQINLAYQNLYKSDTTSLSNKIIESSAKINWYRGVAEGKYLRARKNKKLHYLFEAEANFFDLIKYSEINKLPYFKAIGLQNIGDIYSINHNVKESLRYYTEAIKEFKKAKNWEEICHTNNNIGIALYRDKKYDLARKIFEDNMIISKNKGQSIYLGLAYLNLGHIQSEKEQFHESINLYEKALNISETYSNHKFEELAIALSGISNSYFKLKKYEEAKKYAKLALSKLGSPNFLVIKASNEILIDIYESEGNLSKALLLSKDLLNRIEDQKNSENERSLKSSKAEFELYKANNERVTLQNRNQQLILISTIICVGILVLTFLLNNLRKKNNQIKVKNEQIVYLNKNLENKVDIKTKELQKSALELSIKNSELLNAIYSGQKMERERVAESLHDNLGSLISVLNWKLGSLDYENFSKNDTENFKSMYAISKLAYEDIRNISHNLIPNNFDKKPFSEIFIEFKNKIENENEIKIAVQIDLVENDIDNELKMNLYSISLELLNNAIKHAHCTEIAFKFQKIKQSIIIIIYDDNGIGVKNTMKFRSLENRIKRLEGEIAILDKKKNGLNLKITIPVKI